MATKPKRPIRCLLAEDHAIVREGLQGLLSKERDISVVGDVGDGRSAIDFARKVATDVVIMDVSMPDINGIEATREICSLPGAPRVLCLSVHSERGVVAAMLEAGASGYILKTGAARELIEAVRVVAAGGTYLSPPIVKAVVVGQYANEAGPHLTSRERQVLGLIAEGLHTKEIAHRLHISIKTVFTHREKVMRKLDLRSNVALAKFALRQGISQL
ncbi:MAG TPA: response regulator transcription factor [Verrucomicrobiae bacterium]|nr:response regulator transcription factor [Verrucomicrobiae bacterium]